MFLQHTNKLLIRAIATDETAKKQNLVVDNSECFKDSCETSEAGNILNNLRFKNINRLNSQDVSSILKCIRIKNINSLIIGNLNINSISEKFEQLKTVICGNIDILVVVETKLDDTFPDSQFFIEG